MGELIVCGLGNSAQRFLEEFVRLSPRGWNVTAISGEPGIPYDRPRLSHFIREGASVSLGGRSLEWFSERGIRVVANSPVTRILPAERRVVTASGWELGYTHLVLATGSRPRPMEVEGIPARMFHVLRSLQDAETVRVQALAAGEAVIVGGGVLGVELADALREAGCAVQLVSASDRLLPRCSHEFSAAVLGFLRAKGVVVHLAAPPVRGGVVSESMGLCSLLLANGMTLESRCLVAAIGVVPEDSLARAAGLACAPEGGIETNLALETSSPGIFALGEVARVGGANYGHIEPCFAMAEVLARRLCGDEGASFTPPAPRLVVKVAGALVVAGGEAQGSEWLACEPLPGVRGVRRLCFSGEKMVAYEIVGDTQGAPDIEAALGRSVALDARARFRLSGLLPVSASDSSDFPADRRICNCHQVTVARLNEALSRGVDSFESLRETTGASTGCGSCRPLLMRFCEQRLGHEVADKARSPVVRAPFWAVASAASLYVAACAGFSAWWILGH